jgi:uncharacterized protein YsxB (DUF464 family)
MITAEFIRDREKRTLTMTVRGHAGTAPAGEDLVCAGASTAAYAYAECVEQMAAAGYLRREFSIHVNEGFLQVEAAPKPEHMDKVLQALWQAQVAFQLLAANAPEAVYVKSVGCSPWEPDIN